MGRRYYKGRYYKRRKSSNSDYGLIIIILLVLCFLPIALALLFFYLIFKIVSICIKRNNNKNNKPIHVYRKVNDLNNFNDYNNQYPADIDYNPSLYSLDESNIIDDSFTADENNIPDNKYRKKTQTVTDSEKYFWDILKRNFTEYDVRPQVPLSSVIEKNKTFDKEYQNELFRIIDFGIFDKSTSEPLLLIEINDSTHNLSNRKARDIKVKNICNQADIKLITFWTCYSNQESYIVKRINDELKTIKKE